LGNFHKDIFDFAYLYFQSTFNHKNRKIKIGKYYKLVAR